MRYDDDSNGSKNVKKVITVNNLLIRIPKNEDLRLHEDPLD